MSDALMTDIRRAIESASGSAHPMTEQRFHKHDQYLSYGLKTASFRQITKAFRPRFLALSLRERLNLAAKLLGEHVGELGHTGIHIVALSAEELEPAHFSLLDRLADDFRSWSHVDHFCIEVMKPLLWKYREQTLAFLENWNRSPNRWKRRASVVAFTRKIGASGEFTEDVLRLCEPLVRVLPYIKDLRRKGVSSTIVLYAIRDLKGAERDAVLAVKKE